MNDTANSNTTTPGNSDPQDDFYDAAPPEPLLLYQGEILIDVPIMIMPKPPGWRLLRAYGEEPLEQVFEQGKNPKSVKVVDAHRFEVEWNAALDGDYVLGRLSKAPAVVLSQTCDVQDKDFIQIAPIFPAIATNPEYLNRLKTGSIFSSFYLKPRQPTFGVDSFADLERMQAVHKSYIKKLDADHHFRLKDEKVRALQRAVTRYFGRPNSYTVGDDKVPETRGYLCVNCFYANGIATREDLVIGSEFEPCPVCNGRLWVRMAG